MLNILEAEPSGFMAVIFCVSVQSGAAVGNEVDPVAIPTPLLCA